MPLPDDTSAVWPPVAAAKQLADVAEWDAWYSGDPDKLSAVYGSNGANVRAAQRKRWFWTRRQQQETRDARHQVHLPAAADIASTSADLLFGGTPKLIIPEAHEEKADSDAKAAETRLQKLIEAEMIDATLLEAADAASGLGGVFLRPGWNPKVADYPLLDVVHPDFALPEFTGRHLRAVTFWREVAIDGNTVWRHLERHEPGVVLHGLYIGTRTHLGLKVDLKQHPETAELDVDDDGRLPVPAGITGLMVRYIPNAPNRKRRNSRQGAADTAGALSLMDGLDETYSSWLRDIRLGKMRVIVDQAVLKRSGRGEGATFDEDQEIFVPVDMGPVSMEKGAHPIEVAEFVIRTKEHAETASAMFEAIARSAGYSPQTFGLQGDGSDQTATEVDARENRSLRTTSRKRRYWGREVEEAAYNLLVIDREIFGNGSLTPMRPRLEWPEPGGDDLAERADTLSKIEMARAASTETKVRLLNPEWEREQVAAEVTRIHAEQGLAVPDPTGGLP